MTAYGFDHEARRRAAWVGMCVLKDWSPVLDRMETVGDLVPAKAGLYDYLNGPDRVLLHQVAASWEQLRNTFGDLFAPDEVFSPATFVECWVD